MSFTLYTISAQTQRHDSEPQFVTKKIRPNKSPAQRQYRVVISAVNALIWVSIFPIYREHTELYILNYE